MESDTQTLSLIVGVVIPILVGVLTRLKATAGVKAVVNALLSAVSGALNTLLTNSGSLVWKEFVVAVMLTWVVSVATYYGLWKPTGISQKVQEKTADSGVG